VVGEVRVKKRRLLYIVQFARLKSAVSSNARGEDENEIFVSHGVFLCACSRSWVMPLLTFWWGSECLWWGFDIEI